MEMIDQKALTDPEPGSHAGQRALTELERKFFRDFLEALGNDGVDWIIVRNYEGFPRTIGHDVDLFVPRRHLGKVKDLLRSLIGERGGRILMVHEREYFCDVRFLLDPTIDQAIHLDLYHGAYSWHGLPYITEAELIGGKRLKDGLWIPRPAHEAFGLLFTSLIWGSFFKSRYRDQIHALLGIEGEQSEFERCAAAVFGSAAADWRKAVDGGLDKPAVRSFSKNLRSAFLKMSLKRRPVSSSAHLIRYYVGEFENFFRPRGVHVAVVGAEGHARRVITGYLETQFGDLFGEVHFLESPRAAEFPGPAGADGPELRNPNGGPGMSALFKFWINRWKFRFTRIAKYKYQVHLAVSVADERSPEFEGRCARMAPAPDVLIRLESGNHASKVGGSSEICVDPAAPDEVLVSEIGEFLMNYLHIQKHDQIQ